MLFRPARGIRRYVQDELAFRHAHAFHAGLDSKLHQVVHLRQSFSAKLDLFAGPDGPKEFHAPDRGKKKERFRIFWVTRGRGDARRLGKRFGEDYARHERVVRKMSGEHRIIARKPSRGLRGNPRLALDQLAHKDKRRAMGKTKKVTRFCWPLLLVTCHSSLPFIR